MTRRTVLLSVLVASLVGAPPAPAWTWPADGPVLREFDFEGDPYAAGHHRGIDVGGAPGAPVRAPAGGTVSFAGSVPGGGLTVTIQTPSGHAVTLLHLGSLRVRRGAAVDEGATVASLGASGTPEHPGAYVHLGVRRLDDANGYLDPLTVLPAREAAPTSPPPPPAETPAPAGAPGEPAAPPAAQEAPVEVEEVTPLPAVTATESASPSSAAVASSTPRGAPSHVVNRPAIERVGAQQRARAHVDDAPRPRPADVRTDAPRGTEARSRAEQGSPLPERAARALTEVPAFAASVPPSTPGAAGSEADADFSGRLLVLLAAIGLGAVAFGLRGLAAPQAKSVAQGLDAIAAEPLDRADATEEARTPLLTVDLVARAGERARQAGGVPEPDVGLVSREHKVAFLQPLDWMPDIRRVDRDRPAGDENTGDLREHRRERLVLEMLDEVGCNGLAERRVRERKRRHVRHLEPKRRKERRCERDGPLLRVDSRWLAAERREEVRHRPARRPEVQHAIARGRFDEVANGRQPKLRPWRLVEVGPRHRGHEVVVVDGGRAADKPEPHVAGVWSRR